MERESPGVYLVTPGETVTISVTAQNLALNVDFDPQLTVTIDTPFRKVGTFQMGNARTDLAIGCNFPAALPGGASYTFIVAGAGFADTPFVLAPAPGEALIVQPYVLKVAAEAGGAEEGVGVGRGPR